MLAMICWHVLSNGHLLCAHPGPVEKIRPAYEGQLGHAKQFPTPNLSAPLLLTEVSPDWKAGLAAVHGPGGLDDKKK